MEAKNEPKHTIVLISCDHLDGRIAGVLEHNGYEVLAYQTPREALANLNGHNVGALVFGYVPSTMKDVDGIAKITERYPSAKRFMVGDATIRIVPEYTRHFNLSAFIPEEYDAGTLASILTRSLATENQQ